MLPVRRRARLVAMLLLGASPVAAALAAPVTIVLEPPTTRIGSTIFIVGVFPLPASYQRFHGTLTVDPQAPHTCEVDMLVDVASLHMADPARIKQALGPDMMDAAHYPTMHFTGVCHRTTAGADETQGTLTMHGVTRPITMTVDRRLADIVASGSLRRYDYGVNGLPNLVGREIDFKFFTVLPPNALPAMTPP